MLDSMTGLIPNPDVLAEIRRRLPERREMVRTWRHAAPPISDVTVQLLESLKGRTLGLVTSSDHSDIKPVLSAAGIMECFDACVFGEEMTRHKPDPAPYLLIRKKLAISGGFVFEDSEAGLQSAAGAGFRTVRVGRPDELPALVRNVIDAEDNSLP
jgi:HAD superfamily hydrolase (TIGR01509 family)